MASAQQILPEGKMKQEACGLFSCSVASKAWLLRLSLVPSWLHYPLFQAVQALPAVFS